VCVCHGKQHFHCGCGFGIHFDVGIKKFGNNIYVLLFKEEALKNMKMFNVGKGVQSGYSVEELYDCEALLLKRLQLNPFIIHSFIQQLESLSHPYPYLYLYLYPSLLSISVSFSCVFQCAL